jgi:hypothetical protein
MHRLKLHMTITCQLRYAILHAQPRYAQTLPSLLKPQSFQLSPIDCKGLQYDSRIYELLNTYKLCGNFADRSSSIAHVRMLPVTILVLIPEGHGKVRTSDPLFKAWCLNK